MFYSTSLIMFGTLKEIVPVRKFEAVTEESSESRYEEKDQADYEGEDPGTESFVTVNQPTVLSQTGQTIA